MYLHRSMIEADLTAAKALLESNENPAYIWACTKSLYSAVSILSSVVESDAFESDSLLQEVLTYESSMHGITAESIDVSCDTLYRQIARIEEYIHEEENNANS